MFTIDDIVKNKQITCVCKKNNSEMHSWKALGKHWLQNYVNKFGVDLFSCKCFDIKGITSIPKYYQDALNAWNNFGLCENDILDISIFGNSDIKFNIFKINDIWYENNKTCVDNQTIFNRLDDKRNSISEWGEIKKN
jgi:hypothetical protein